MTNEQNKKRWPKALRIALLALASLIGLALALAIVYYALYQSGRHSFYDRENSITPPASLVETIEDEGKTVVYQGKTYRYNEAVVSLLFLGVDKQSIGTAGSYGTNGQADSLFLATLDTKTGAVKVIPLSRESMVDVNLYAVDGSYLGSKKTQLCLAYAYAAGAKQGCENVMRSVGRLLYGMPIDGYIALDMNGVVALNRAVGGIQVTVPEQLIIQAAGQTITLRKGQTIRLNNDTVLPYIRNREEDAGANERRMIRQKQFLNEFIRVAAAEVKRDFSKLETYYTAAKPYTASDLTLAEITYLASTYLVGGQQSITYQAVTGKSVAGAEHAEFYPDEVSLYETILDTFYIAI